MWSVRANRFFETDTHKLFLDNLETFLSGIPNRNHMTLMGDFNARIGKETTGWEGVFGDCGQDPSVKQNGTELVELCARHGLVLANTMQRQRYPGTWFCPANKKWYQIDYIITRRKHLKDFRRVRVQKHFDLYSDHRPVSVSIRPHFHAKSENRTAEQDIKAVAAAIRSDGKLRDQYQQAVTEILTCGRKITATELGSTLLTAAKSLDTGWETRRQRQDWVTKEVVKACEAKRAAFRHWEHGGRHVIAWENYCFLRCQAKTAVREAKQHYMERLAIQAQAAARNNDPRELYRLAKAIKPPTPLALGGQLLAKDGQSYLTTEEEKMERWSQYFDELLNPVDSQNNLPYDN
eukprot:Lankesteria_metandrocarpae@DN5226_c0_g1_i2.p1